MSMVVDLTLPIREHWRYPIKSEIVESRAKGNIFQVTEFCMKTHWYTHIDACRHISDEGRTLDQYSLDPLVGEAIILDCTEVQANTLIDAAMLERAMQGKEKRNLLLIRTDWGKKCSWDTKAFWAEAPYITEDGAKFIDSCAPEVVGFDFPQDYNIRLHTGALDPTNASQEDWKYQPCHDLLLLKKDIRMIENMTNMWNIPSMPYCKIAALPLNLIEADGAPIRVFAYI